MTKSRYSTRLAVISILARHVTTTHCLTLTIRRATQHNQSQVHHLAKRSTSPHKVGTGMAITISVIIFGIVVFYLGMRRGRTGSWFCWRQASDSNHANTSPQEPPRPISTTTTYRSKFSRRSLTPDPEKELMVEKQAHLQELVFHQPKLHQHQHQQQQQQQHQYQYQNQPQNQRQSHQPAELSPLTPQHTFFAELPSPTTTTTTIPRPILPPLNLPSHQTRNPGGIFELSTNPPSNRTSWFDTTNTTTNTNNPNPSSERKNWFTTNSSRRASYKSIKSTKSSKSNKSRRSKSNRSKSRETSGVYEMAASPVEGGLPPVPPLPPKYPEGVRVRGEDGSGNGGNNGGGVDWSGMEWMRKMYVERKSLYREGR